MLPMCKYLVPQSKLLRLYLKYSFGVSDSKYHLHNYHKSLHIKMFLDIKLVPEKHSCRLVFYLSSLRRTPHQDIAAYSLHTLSLLEVKFVAATHT